MTTQAPPRTNPFPGLRPFESNENDLFFGRDGQSDELLRRLREKRFVAVVGTSGSGKSSLVRAGLLPSLHGGFMIDAGSSWRVTVFRPGNDPIGNLAEALNKEGVLRTADDDAEMLRAITETTLRRSAIGLVNVVQQARIPESENLLIVVDQFEELFRFKQSISAEHSEDDAAAFVKLLLEATRQKEVPIYIVVTMRSDFLGDCAQFRDLPEAINGSQYLIPRMTRDQRREAISGPVAVGGGQITPRLVNRLLNDVGDNPDQLPILQHALMRTWQRCAEEGSGKMLLDIQHYEDIGGMSEALSRHADKAYDELQDERSQRIAEKLFKLLTEKGSDNREIRRPTKLREICEVAEAEVGEVIAVIERFRREGRSFLMPPSNVALDAESLIDISHESLIRGWERLKKWVDEEAMSARIYRRLADTTALYEAKEAGLWHDPDLAIALAWREKARPNETWAARYDPNFESAMRFLDKSRAMRDAEIVEHERQRVRNLRRIQAFAAILCVAFLLSLGLAFYAYGQKKIAQQRALDAEQAQQSALTHAAIAREQALNAEQRRQEANAAKDEAIQARNDAQEAREAAEKSATQAREALLVAQQQKLIAEQQTQKAETARLAALDATRKAKEAAENLRHAVLRERKRNLSDKSWVASLAEGLINTAPPQEAAFWRSIRAGALTDLGQHEEAEKELSLALAAAPDYAAARMSRGYMYMLNNKVEESIDDFDYVLKLNPNSSITHLNKAISVGILKRYAEATAAIEKAIQTFTPGSDDTFYENEISPDIERATGHRTIMAYENDFYSALYYQLANIEAYAGGAGFKARLAEINNHPRSLNADITAINWAWLHLKNRPDDYGAWASQGAFWEHAGFASEAVCSYRKFQSRHQEKRDQRYDNLARWVSQRMTELPHVDSCTKEKPDIRKMALEAEELIARSKLPEAEKLLTEALKLEPENKGLLLQRAKVRFIRKQYGASGDDAREALSLSPDLPKAYLYRGVTGFLTGNDTRQSEDDIRKALHYDPFDFDALSVLSYVVKNHDEALEWLDKSIKVRPHDAQLYYRKAQLLNKNNRYDEALKAINVAIAIKLDSLEFYDERSTAEQGRNQNKVEAVRNQAAGYGEAADNMRRLGQTGKALDTYARSLKMLAEIAQGRRNVNIQSDMIVTIHKISRMLEEQGSKAKAIEFLNLEFGNVKGLEETLKDEISCLSASR